MEKIDSIASSAHSISINERKSIIITGVKKIDSFDTDEFFMQTNMGNLIIKGEQLEMIKLDTYQGNVSIKGKINELNYTEEEKKINENSFFGKLFK